jgi:hypothetical protein
MRLETVVPYCYCFGIFCIFNLQGDNILRHPWKTKFRGMLSPAGHRFQSLVLLRQQRFGGAP